MTGDERIDRGVGHEVLDLEVLHRCRIDRKVHAPVGPYPDIEGRGGKSVEYPALNVRDQSRGPVGQRLAGFFGVPLEEFTSRRGAYRKRLTAFLEESEQTGSPVVLKLENGEEITGKVEWFAREAVAVAPEDTGEEGQAGTGTGTETRPYIVQRAYVADWRPADSAQWEVGT